MADDTLLGDGRLVTRDGAYRAGRYEVPIHEQPGHVASASGSFTLAPGAGDHGPPEEFLGLATLVLADGTETDVELGGREEDTVAIIGIGPVPTAAPPGTTGGGR